MKKIKLFAGLIILLLSSCQTQEVLTNNEELVVSAEIAEMVETSSIYKLAVQMQDLSTNESLTALEKKRLVNFSQLILNDLGITEKVSKSTTLTKSNSIFCNTKCYNEYFQCTWWARSWENLLALCNGPESNRPNNCDQIREDYFKNLDEIEATYHNCILKMNKCYKRCSGSSPIGGNPV